MEHALQSSTSWEEKFDLQPPPSSKHIFKMCVWYNPNRLYNAWRSILIFNTTCADDLFNKDKKLIFNRIHNSGINFDEFVYACSSLLLHICSRLKASSWCLSYHDSNLIAGLTVDGSTITVVFHIPLSQHALSKWSLQGEAKHEIQYMRDCCSRILHNNGCMVGVTINDHKVTTPLLGMKRDGDPKAIAKSICESFSKLKKAVDD